MVLLTIIAAGLGGYFIGKQTTASPRMGTLEDSIKEGFSLGKYKYCIVYQRNNINIPPNALTLSDASKVVCKLDGEEQTLLKVLDKNGFETAVNSIYRIWNDGEGYKALIVDQNGAGSGEGIGKIILLKNGNYKLLDCFYYVPENFSGKYQDPLSSQEITAVKENSDNPSHPSCNNFTIKSLTN